jgi:hypothetical protein
VLRRFEEARHVRGLHDAPGIHDGDAVGELRHDAEVVRDQEQRHADGASQLREQAENLRLHGDVERGGDLVRDDEVGSRTSAMAITTRCCIPPTARTDIARPSRPGSGS